MQAQATRTRTFPALRSPWRLMAVTLVVAAAATAAQTAFAQPFGGGRGQHGGGHEMMMGGRGGPGMMAPRHMDRMLDSVGATAEQRAQIRQIFDAASTDMKAQREGGRALREQAAALFTQPTVDARAAEGLRQQMLARHDTASKRMLQAMLDVSRVLTPEQRKQIGERMAMMQRHRAERAALGASAPRR